MKLIKAFVGSLKHALGNKFSLERVKWCTQD